MHTIKIILLAALFPFTVEAQVVFKTIVPQQPVEVGVSFQVQYVLQSDEKNESFKPPAFKGFRVVSGPNVYRGSASNQNAAKNIAFTLEPLKPGRFKIPGATAIINGRVIKSNDAVIRVSDNTALLRKEADQQKVSEYFLRPDEDPYEKMRKNLFMKVMVDKKTCYVGQPVVATFKLYSRLESRSDIVKNPGFYGFTVQDVVSLKDNIVSTETVNGKAFDVHTIRIVQLYPLQAGLFTIDAMEVMNKVEFSRSIVSKKTEQEINEGVVEDNEAPVNNDKTVTYENSINTEKIVIRVKPYPVMNKPSLFSGATGKFFISSKTGKDELARNEESTFVVTLGGKGNFTQLSAPVVQWPAGIEGFDPVIKDSLDKTQSPLKGIRRFYYSFVSGKSGNYTIPAIQFSFFDPDSNRYKTISSSPVIINVLNKEKEETRPVTDITIERKNKTWWWLYAAGLLALVLGLGLVKKKRKNVEVKKKEADAPADTISLDQILQPALFALKADNNNFYSLLQKATWDYLGMKLNLSGSKMNKYDLQKAMKEKNVDEAISGEILEVLHRCEASVFTKAAFADEREELLNKAKKALGQINV